MKTGSSEGHLYNMQKYMNYLIKCYLVIKIFESMEFLKKLLKMSLMVKI